MTDNLLNFLQLHLNDDYVLINDFLKSNHQYKTKSCEQLQQYLSKLVAEGKIEVQGKAHKQLGIHTRLNQGDYQNTLTDLDNWPMLARITELGKKEIQSSSKMWYDTENAKRQFHDYPKTKLRTIWAFIISIISLGVTIVLGILNSK